LSAVHNPAVPRPLLLAIEHAAVRAWPAVQTAAVDGWLWRHTSGGSLRANSAATLAFGGSDCETAIAQIEHLYRQRDAPCRFTVSDVAAPPDLDARLAARGYERGADHVTLAKTVAADAAMPDEVELARDPSPRWLEVYASGLSPDRRDIAPRILAGLPSERTYVSCRRAHAVISSGLSVGEGALASVQCMATLPAERRRGGALSVLRAIEACAHRQGRKHLYLQAEAANSGAIALYEAFGFRLAGTYHLRWKP
jgi:GNAT superfamily N-acetyltransferase